jgi:hypothetical protein
MEEFIKTLYTELYLTIKEIADMLGLYDIDVAKILWKERLERTGGKTKSYRLMLRKLSDEQKAEYIHKARQLGVPYKLIAKVLGMKQKEVRRLERSLSSRV